MNKIKKFVSSLPSLWDITEDELPNRAMIGWKLFENQLIADGIGNYDLYLKHIKKLYHNEQVQKQIQQKRKA